MIVTTPDPYTFCPCGSGKKYKFCCRRISGSEIVPVRELEGILSDLSQAPVAECWLTGDYRKSMSLVMGVLVRSLPGGGFLVVEALVDRLFLGVKNCNWGRAISPADVRCKLVDIELLSYLPAWERKFGRSASFFPDGTLDLSHEARDCLMEDIDELSVVDMTLHPVDYEELRSFILGAVAYARQFDQPPHPDWNYVKRSIEADRPFEPAFTYGVDGRPFYIAGPNDDFSRISRGLARAKELLGPSGTQGQGSSRQIPAADWCSGPFPGADGRATVLTE